jgi:hypothetical protein
MDRRSATWELVARELEKLVLLVKESQEQQHQFMQEAYRLLQEQSQEMTTLHGRVHDTDGIVAKLNEVLTKVGSLAGNVKITIDEKDDSPTPFGNQIDGVQKPDGQDHDDSKLHEAGSPLPSLSDEMEQKDVGASTGEAGQEEEAVPAVKPMPLPDEAEVEGVAEGPQGGEKPGMPVEETMTGIRFLHASPDAPAVDLYVDGARVTGNLSYGELSDRLPIAAGRHRIQVYPAGKSVGAVVDTVANIRPDLRYTVAVAGVWNDLRSVVIEDQVGMTKPGFARMKVVHLAAKAPSLDVTLPSGRILIGHLVFKGRSPYMQVTPGTRELELRVAGKREVALKLADLLFEPDATYSLYVLGGGGQPLRKLFMPEG